MPIIALDKVSKSFGALKVADAISFEVAEGEALGIIGPNGAGKSTLFNLITGNIEADSGRVSFLGGDVTQISAMERCRAGIGRSFQIPQPFGGMTVFENLLVAGVFGQGKSQREVEGECATILERTGLLPKANTVAGKLSLLERKRLELARALATAPKLLLLDEIAGGLTEAECGRLVGTIREIHAGGTTIIWIEHVLHALTSVVERLLVLNFGQVVGIGAPDAIMARRDVREIYLGLESLMALLSTHGLTAHYGQLQALFGIDITLEAGECVAIIGANGAGKTSLMRAISGVLPGRADSVRFRGEPIGHLSADAILTSGIAMVPEGRKLFPSLTVEENLLVGAHARKGSGPWSLDAVYELFPILRERRKSPGTALSGGQQQMVAIGRALMSNPDVLLCDEISLGLAPVVIRDIYAAVPKIRAGGAALIIVEQDIGQALRTADRVCCMMEGRVTLSGDAKAISRDAIHTAYFGAAA